MFSKPQLSIILPVYAAIASILPVWVLLCPRDYLSSYMKIGVIVVLAVGIFVAHPVLKMPATTPFIHGGGPVVPGTVWPFVCIVIMCGALSGFHALIASGTTPKMIDRESDIRPIGYGGDAAGGLRVDHGPGGRLRPGAGRLLQDQHPTQAKYAAARRPRREGRAPTCDLRAQGVRRACRTSTRRGEPGRHGRPGPSPWPWAWPRSSPACPA